MFGKYTCCGSRAGLGGGAGVTTVVLRVSNAATRSERARMRACDLRQKQQVVVHPINNAAPKNGTTTGRISEIDISNTVFYFHMPLIMATNEVSEKERVALLEALEKTATNKFLFRGTRKVRNAAGSFINFEPDVILPGRKPLPYSSYIRDVDPATLPAPVRLSALRNAENETRFLPSAATKLTLNRSGKSLKLRQGLFMPIEIRGMDDWIERQRKYIDELPNRDMNILNSYTSHGDIIVNGYCRGTLKDITDLLKASLTGDISIPLAYSLYDQYDEYRHKIALPARAKMLDEDGDLDMSVIKFVFANNLAFFGNPKNIMTLLEQYKQDLMRIIVAAPKLNHDIIVYRGIESEAHLTGLRYVNKDFLSTTIDPFSVLDFTKVHEDPKLSKKIYCCVYELTIRKTVPCLYMQYISLYGNEFEVLIPPGMEIQLSKQVQTKVKPPSRLTTSTTILEPYFKEHVLVVHGNVTKPVAKATRKNARRKGAAGYSRKKTGMINLSAIEENYNNENNDNNYGNNNL